MRSCLALATALALAACAHQPAGEAAGEPLPKAQVHFYDMRPPSDGRGELTVRFDDGTGQRTVRPGDFQLREWGFPTSERLATRAGGTLHVEVALSRSGRVVSNGSVDLPLKPDWTYGISLRVTGGNPLEGCMGCMGVRSFPIDGATGPSAEQLHIVWGGNSISAPLPS